MSGELFPREQIESHSPRLRWMNKHDISTFCFEDADGTEEWTARIHGVCSATSTTENWALIKLAEKLGIPDWRQS